MEVYHSVGDDQGLAIEISSSNLEIMVL